MPTTDDVREGMLQADAAKQFAAVLPVEALWAGVLIGTSAHSVAAGVIAWLLIQATMFVGPLLVPLAAVLALAPAWTAYSVGTALGGQEIGLCAAVVVWVFAALLGLGSAAYLNWNAVRRTLHGGK